jgi:DNA-binding LacI/PurR family transcriptional regulator
MKNKKKPNIHREQGTLWEETLEKALKDIAQGKFKRGDKFYSTTELAKKYKVSNITCRRVLSELAGRGIIESVPNKGSFLKNTMLKREINLFVYDGVSHEERVDRTPIYPELYKGIVREADSLNVSLKTVNRKYLESCSEPGEMLLLLIEHLPEDKNLRRILTDKNKKCVCCHSVNADNEISTVRSDYTKGVYLAVSHLISLGHRRIAFFSCPLESRWVPSRFDGYYQALKKNNIDLDFSLIKETEEANFKENIAAIEELLALHKPPSAIFALNDNRALQILDHCQRNGIKVPDELSVVGFDNLPEAALSEPPLTTIDNFWEEQGRMSVRLLLELAEETTGQAKDVMAEPELIKRESSGKWKNS